MIAVDVSPTIMALAAAAVYVATYLSFLRLLKLPRAWIPIGLPAALPSVVLAALMAALVSLSAEGLDGAALAIWAGFMVSLFGIIAAPAIAFQPASRVIEFFARHGEYAGLWLLGPAVAAGLAVPNIKLQAVMAAAMSIELAWFLGSRSKGGRRLYPIGGHDLSVLQAQANGDLEGFSRRHGMHELALSGDAVNWRGCSKQTQPCPISYYVNRLGLNTAPCCRQHMAELCRYVVSCLQDMGVDHWLDGGTLLGAVREDGGFLAWDDDVDVSVVLDDATTFEGLASGLAERGARDGYFVDIFKKEGFLTVSYDRPRAWPLSWHRNRMRGEIRLDMSVYRHALSHGEPVLERIYPKGAMPVTESGCFGIPRGVVLPTTTIDFLGGQSSCPNQAREYLRLVYGDFDRVVYSYVDAAAAENRSQTDIDARN